MNFIIFCVGLITQNHTWYAEVDMLGNPKYGKLQGVLSTVFNPVTGRALFPHLKITGFGFFYVQFRVNSDPSDFNLTLNEKMIIMNPDHVGMVAEEQYEIQVHYSIGKIIKTKNR